MMFRSGCPTCGGRVSEGTTTFTVDKDNVLVVVRNVPARVCAQCGESWIMDHVAEELEQIVANARSNRSQLQIVDMAA